MISLCVTTFNRDDLVIKCIEQVLDDDRISEIVIVDDHSDYGYYKSLLFKLTRIDRWKKVKFYRNEVNLDCYRNKKRSVELATNPWVIVFDSDNVMTKAYVDIVFTQIENLKQFGDEFDKNIAYCPDFAKPHFNFQKWSGKLIDRSVIGLLIEDGALQTLLNAMNYFVNRDQYLRVWNENIDPVTSDSLYQNYRWLEAGNKIYVVPGLQYEHRIHDGSHYKNNVKRTPVGFHEEILQRLRDMK